MKETKCVGLKGAGRFRKREERSVGRSEERKLSHEGRIGELDEKRRVLDA